MTLLIATPLDHLPEVMNILNSIEEIPKLYMPDPSLEDLKRVSRSITHIFTNPNKLKLEFDSNLLTNMDQLACICTASTGTNHINIDLALSRKIDILCLKNQPGVINQITGTAEHAVALSLAGLRRLPSAYHSVQRGCWDYEGFIGRQIRGLVVGVVGYGRLGSLFASYLDSFGAKTLVYDPYVSVCHVRHRQVGNLMDLIEQSDLISLHVHVTPETQKMINHKSLAHAKTDVTIVNTSRGEVVDEAAIIDFLHSNPSACYATDVLADERYSFSRSPLLTTDELLPHQLIVTPHCGGMTREGQHRAFSHAACLLKSYIEDGDRSQLYKC